ncbi:hypothetical protein SCHPADRAFT_712603 [Schizopora paradoxa]|uniref:F-box domain-containing protein n=1 Tax=Schizopora paradoxa TaxID=27342 RepID=A0A0H2R1Y2_9AGAM|nr:hypothetical protein SCHPADRAFT_712603 [Schizopora paradoxa]
MDVQVSSKLSIADIPPDVVHRVVEISLLTHLPEPIGSRADAIKFFSSVPPYNFALTCRNWRNTVLSSDSLWSSLSLSLDLPDDEVWNAMKWKIDKHLAKARNIPLTLFLRLSRRHNDRFLKAREVIAFLHSRRLMWKRVVLDVEAPIIFRFALGIKDLQLLEEIRVGSSVMVATANSGLPSLKCLELVGLPSSYTMDWLPISPNLRELSFLNIPLSYASFWESHSARSSNARSFSFLRTLRITRAEEPSPPARESHLASFVACLLNSITSHALTVLDLYLYSLDSHQALFNFLCRCSPPLEALGLDVHFVVQGDEIEREELLIHALLCVPSVRKLRYRGDLDGMVVPEVLVRALSFAGDESNPPLLPELEHLELVNVAAELPLFFKMVKVRHPPKTRTLKSMSLLGCFAKAPGMMSNVREELGTFEPGDDVTQLPASLSALGKFVSAGLELKMKQISDTGEL